VLSQLRAYYILTKPGIIKGNALHVLAGALFASFLPIDWIALLGVTVGTSLVIASACVANNYIDRDIDARMARTKRRPSVTGEVSPRNALLFSTVLLLLGAAMLYIYTNPIVMGIGALAYVLYVFAYGWAKRHTVHSTLVGAVPGALPILAGHVAVAGGVTYVGMLLFLLVFTWQMPHFYAISILRKKEYAAARVPVLAVVTSFKTVQTYILIYMIAYLVSIAALVSTGRLGVPAGFLLLAGAALWFMVYITIDTHSHIRWARAIFRTSLVLSVMLLAAAILNIYVPAYSSGTMGLELG
jgi:heme o synthase